jgi:iron complex outermembrane receptor protein
MVLKLGENNKIRLFPISGIAYKVVENKDGIVNDFKIRGNLVKQEPRI